MAAIACILINYRFPEDTLACLRSLQESARKAVPFPDSGVEIFKIFLINNFPGDGSGALLKPFLDGSGMPYAYFEPGGNLGYTGGMNLGIQAALLEDIPTLLILNNDTVAAPDFAAQALEAVRAHPGAVVSGTVLDADTGKVSFNIGRLSKWTTLVQDIFEPGLQKDIDFVSGCMMFVPASVFRQVGFFDDRYFMYREDFDLCLRWKAQGVRIIHRPEIMVRHKVSSSTDRSGTPKEYYRMRNQTHIIMRRASFRQIFLYWIFLAFLLVYKARHPKVLAQFLKGIRDALIGRLGPV